MATTYEDEYKAAVERRKQGIFNGASPTEIDKKYNILKAPTVEEKYKSINDYQKWEQDNINSGKYDDPDYRRQWLSPNEQKLWDAKGRAGLTDMWSQDPRKPSKYDDWNAYFTQNDVNQGMNNSDTALSSGGARNSYSPSASQRQALSYDEAAGRAKQQLDPLYDRALENVRKNRYQNELNASEVASARGLAHSGLAADQMNKIGIAAQSKRADLDAPRPAKTAEMAQRMMEFDQNLALQERGQALSEYLGIEGLNLNREQFDWGKYTNQRDFDYGRSRDLIGDHLIIKGCSMIVTLAIHKNVMLVVMLNGNLNKRMLEHGVSMLMKICRLLKKLSLSGLRLNMVKMLLGVCTKWNTKVTLINL